MASHKQNNHRDRMARIMAVSSTWTAKPMRTRLNPISPEAYDRYWADRLGGAPPAKETRLVTTAVTAGALSPAVTSATQAGLSKSDKAKVSKIDKEINAILDARKGRRGPRPAAEKQKLAALQAEKAAILGEAPAPTPTQTATAIVEEAVKVTETAASNAADSVESIRLNIKAIEDYYAERGGKPGRPKAGFGKEDLKALKAKLAAAEAAAGAAATAADAVKDIADAAGVAIEAKPGRKPGRKPGPKPGPKPASTAAAAKEAKDLTGVAVEAAQEAQVQAEDVADETAAIGEAEGVDLPVVDSVPEPLVQASGADLLGDDLFGEAAAILTAIEGGGTPEQAVEAGEVVAQSAEDKRKAEKAAKKAALLAQIKAGMKNNPRRNSEMRGIPGATRGTFVNAFMGGKLKMSQEDAESFFDYINDFLIEGGIQREQGQSPADYFKAIKTTLNANLASLIELWKSEQEDEDGGEDEDTTDEPTDPGFDEEAAHQLIIQLIDKEIEALLGTRANRSRSRSNFGRRNRF